MMKKRSLKKGSASLEQSVTPGSAKPLPTLIWLKARYHFHTFAYRDPRSAFSSAVALPVVSPTTVLLGMASTLFSFGREDDAMTILENAHLFQVVVDPPEGVIFFRAFHQIRRYETDKYGANARIGLTAINQGTREYGLPSGNLTLFVGVPDSCASLAKIALQNREHLGTHDSMCALIGEIEECSQPTEIAYFPMVGKFQIPTQSRVTVVTLSRFKQPIQPTVGKHWWMAGGDDTELVPYVIQGSFRGTTRGKIYRKT